MYLVATHTGILWNVGNLHRKMLTNPNKKNAPHNLPIGTVDAERFFNLT